MRQFLIETNIRSKRLFTQLVRTWQCWRAHWRIRECSARSKLLLSKYCSQISTIAALRATLSPVALILFDAAALDLLTAGIDEAQVGIDGWVGWAQVNAWVGHDQLAATPIAGCEWADSADLAALASLRVVVEKGQAVRCSLVEVANVGFDLCGAIFLLLELNKATWSAFNSISLRVPRANGSCSTSLIVVRLLSVPRCLGTRVQKHWSW